VAKIKGKSMEKTEKLRNIEQAIKKIDSEEFFESSINLFNTLGYNTTRQSRLDKPTFSEFEQNFLDQNDNIPDISKFKEKAQTDNWKKVELLFQLTDAEMKDQATLFDTGKFDDAEIYSYLFIAIELKPQNYNRTTLSDITRQINRVFSMPVLLLFKNGDNVTISIIKRRLHKRDASRDVLEKVTLIKDINIKNPHRAHVEILFDLSLEELRKQHTVTNFTELQNAWQKTLDVSTLNKKFYKELSNWYFWAIKHVTFPSESIYKDEKKQQHKAQNVIRLLTRLLFVWFIKEKKLIPEELFDLEELQKNILKKIEPEHFMGKKQENTESIYYKAILQNLFFATLNCPIKPDSIDSRERGFRGDDSYGKHRGVDYLMRYKKYFKDPDKFLEMVNRVVPFLNGGLFECLDDKENNIYIDGFSDNMSKTDGKKNVLIVPDYLFFGRDETVDLSSDYGVKNKGTKEASVKGLINILKSYKFTIEENTPIEEDVALDPELLGKVFENLLASFNPETKTTARKQTGSFYTPREIVNYMVDESLIAHLKNSIDWDMDDKELDEKLHALVSFDEVNPFENNSEIAKKIIHSLDNCKILDPACGSGAFPMGILQKMVHILNKVDPKNEYWQELQLEKAAKETEGVFAVKDKAEREQLLLEINEAFDETINNPDYARKLFLIENCIYGVDIQPIATQISKLRFFISLVVEQKVNNEKDNFGIRPLPNLETKFVTANTLVGIDKPQKGKFTGNLFDTDKVKKLELELKNIRHKLFGAKTKSTKVKYRKRDEELRNEIAKELQKNGWGNETAKQLANWDPYDQNGVSPFFDPEWMFDIKDGFDIVIGNPPWIQSKTLKKEEKQILISIFKTAIKQFDLFNLFIEKGINLLVNNGSLCLITPDRFINNIDYFPTRKYIVDNFKLNQVISLGDGIFENVNMPSAIIFVSKSRKFSNVLLKEKLFGEWKVIEQNKILKDKDYIFPVYQDEVSSLIIEIINSKSKTFSEFVFNGRGEEIGKKHPAIIQKEEKESIPFLVGEDIGRYKLQINNYLALESLDFELKSDSNYSVNQILIRKTGTGINAVLDKQGYRCIQVIYIFRVKPTININPFYFLGIINSKLLSYWYHSMYGEKDRATFPHLTQGKVLKLPISIINSFIIPIVYVTQINQFSFINNFKQSGNIDMVLNALIFNLYFPDHMKEREIDVLQFVEKDIEEVLGKKDFEKLSDAEKEKVIAELHKRWSDPNSEIVKRMNSFAEKSPDILKPILES